MGTNPPTAFVAAHDGAFGLTIANRGLPEYEALDAPGGVTIAVTLLRCVGWLSRGDLASRRGPAGPELRTPGAQMHGRRAFDYSIIPHEGDWHAASAHVLAAQSLRPMRARWNRHGIGRIDAEGALLRVTSPDFPVTCIKRAEDGDGAVVRLYNIAPGEAATGVDLLPLQGAAARTNLNEEHLADEARAAAGVHLRARTNEIITLRFRAE
jgi:alpha-mannosidase